MGQKMNLKEQTQKLKYEEYSITNVQVELNSEHNITDKCKPVRLIAQFHVQLKFRLLVLELT